MLVEDEDAKELLGESRSEIPPEVVDSFFRAPPQKRAPCTIARIGSSCMILILGGLIYLTYIPYIEHYNTGTIGGNFCILVFHFFLGMMIASYVQVAYTDPGGVPIRWHKAIERMAQDAEEKQQSFERYQLCRRTNFYRPPRAHFDAVTRRLVLNFDHFCPWTTNSIGFFNRKFFILFLIYTALTCGWAALTLYPFVSGSLLRSRQKVLADNDNLKLGRHGFMTMLAFIFDVVFFLCLLGFAIAHVYMATRNMTSLENGRRSRRYKLSTRENLESVFGKNPYLWALPIYGDGPHGDGIHWPTLDGSWDGLEFDLNQEERKDLEKGLP